MGDAYFDTHIINFMKKVVKWCSYKISNKKIY